MAAPEPPIHPEAEVLTKAVGSSDPSSASAVMDSSAGQPAGRMRGEECRPAAAAVQAVAPADKEREEPAPLSTEKIKREVSKPKTSSSAREAAAGGGTASAAAEAERPSPLTSQGEPPRVAQQSAAQPTLSTEKHERSLPVSQACEHQQEEKDPEQPSDRSSPPSDKKPKDCKPGHQSVDEAAMRKKIVVVEEVVEVKMIGSPGVAGGSPPPVAAVTEATGEEVDMDVQIGRAHV